MKVFLEHLEPESFCNDDELVRNSQFGWLFGEVQHDQTELVVERQQIVLFEVILRLLSLSDLPRQRILMILDDEPKFLAECTDIFSDTVVLVQLQYILVRVELLVFKLCFISLWIVYDELDQCVLNPGLAILDDCDLAIDLIAIFPDTLKFRVDLGFDVFPG